MTHNKDLHRSPWARIPVTIEMVEGRYPTDTGSCGPYTAWEGRASANTHPTLTLRDGKLTDENGDIIVRI